MKIRELLTLSFVIDATLRLGLELGSDAIEKLVQALAGSTWGTSHDAWRVAVIHGDGVYVLVLTSWWRAADSSGLVALLLRGSMRRWC